MRERIIYYLSRMITDQIGSGNSYSNIKRSICILITDFVLVSDSVSYHNRYRLHDPRTGSTFSNLLEIDTLELPKLPQDGDGSSLWDWLKFVSARSMEVLEMLAEKNPQIRKTVVKLVELNAEERERMIADARNKMRWDNASRERTAIEKGLEEGRKEGRKEGWKKGREEERLAIARRLLDKGQSVADVMDITGLSGEEIQSLLQ